MNQTEFVSKRAQAHTAGTLGIAHDPLVQAAIAARNPTPIPPMASPMLPGWNTRRQAE